MSATNIMMTTKSCEGQICGVTSPKPTVEKVTTQKYRESNRVRLLPALSRCWIPQMLIRLEIWQYEEEENKEEKQNQKGKKSCLCPNWDFEVAQQAI